MLIVAFEVIAIFRFFSCLSTLYKLLALNELNGIEIDLHNSPHSPSCPLIIILIIEGPEYRGRRKRPVSPPSQQPLEGSAPLAQGSDDRRNCEDSPHLNETSFVVPWDSRMARRAMLGKAVWATWGEGREIRSVESVLFKWEIFLTLRIFEKCPVCR